MRPVSGSYWTLTPKKNVKTPHGPLMISPIASNLNPLDSSFIKDYKSCCARRKDMDFWETFLCKGETQISWQKSITTETISVKCRHQGPNKTLLKARRFFQVWAIISCNFAVGIFSLSFMRVSENLLSWVKRVETVWALVAYDDGGCLASPPLNRASDSPASATASDASAEKAAEENFKCHNRRFHPRSSHLDLGWTLSNWQSALAGFYMYKLLVRESSPFDLLSLKCLGPWQGSKEALSDLKRECGGGS